MKGGGVGYVVKCVGMKRHTKKQKYQYARILSLWKHVFKFKKIVCLNLIEPERKN